MTIATVCLAEMGLGIEIGPDEGENQYRVRVWNNVWAKSITFSAVDPWDLACNVGIALGKLLGHAKKAQHAGELG